jgi:hypothetical protein
MVSLNETGVSRRAAMRRWLWQTLKEMDEMYMARTGERLLGLGPESQVREDRILLDSIQVKKTD